MNKTQPNCGHTLFHDRCTDCKALQSEYYQKLKEENFIDIEDVNHPDPFLKAWHSFRFFLKEDHSNGASKMSFQTQYYQLANQLLHTYPFEKPIHRLIWELHCEGKSKRQIEEVVAQSEFEKKYKRESILNIIRKIAREIII